MDEAKTFDQDMNRLLEDKVDRGQ
jgi:hypothetical protein